MHPDRYEFGVDEHTVHSATPTVFLIGEVGGYGAPDIPKFSHLLFLVQHVNMTD